MNIHIITPFYRTELIESIVKLMEPMGIHLYPMVTPERDLFPKIDWIHPVYTQELRGWPIEACFRKLNDFAYLVKINDDDYYGFMTDDDMYEPGFFDIIRQQTAKVVFCSLYRGDTTPPSCVAKHPTWPLIIRGPQDVRVCNIGLPQYIIKGEIYKQHRFNYKDKWGDGYFAETLKNAHPNDLKFLPDSWVLAGYHQQGRYTDASKLIKPTWRLPS